jgi:hypothetical protein|uniref:Ribonuclease II winged helix domain-containing protein n=1 Tax=Attheya septentrionalis TaxID=420275 RepID=A0A7S2XMW8_9STRA|mmetsp:Transcript_20618/g.37303  ORF Transcript_20618/g.37303 Transcript_20618/m.37303 type:complete len:236 (+) Transcript_20618:175-882(+)|eukprot:CAMPEP_0198282026 /NCGR_PEP_ID=MMETSP1449-20131203/1899_1 /TAXON_ID=420275 /ORGANISM="Attheya septentrionalis, Strain CCMP2084" /LENGTH=235 /DNA_ID=CAMNT_0043978097 /DNA_START=165 /DNA_END=872 /DNA_ORIENTATION=+
MMNHSLFLLCLGAVSVNAFVQPQFANVHRRVFVVAPLCSAKTDDDVTLQNAFGVGAFVEFQEKKRTHVGKIDTVEHKSSGGARYTIIDSEGKKYGVADKAVLYSMPSPNSVGQAAKLFDDFCRAQDAPDVSLQDQLDISPYLLEMAWEEVSAEDDEGGHIMTPNALIELVHSHTASALEKYLAWKLLKTDLAHVFFKEIKDHGRVVAFKAKTEKAVEAAKQSFCKSHEDSEICFV